MGLFDIFGGGFDKQVEAAVAEVQGLGIGVEGLRAEVQGKTITLHGTAKDMDAKRRAMEAIDQRVKADNILNRITLERPPAPAPAEPGPALAEQPADATPTAAEGLIHEVVSGDTLSGIAKKYYGNGNLYMRIFEANRDVLDNPDLIRVGQKLKIPSKE